MRKKCKKVFKKLFSFFTIYRQPSLKKLPFTIWKYITKYASEMNSKYFPYTYLLYRNIEKNKFLLDGVKLKWNRFSAIKKIELGMNNNKLNSITIKQSSFFYKSHNAYKSNNYLFNRLNNHSIMNLSDHFYKFHGKFYKMPRHYYPISGMRIEISGPPKKGRRRMITFYRRWVPHASLLGKFSSSYASLDVMHWQTFFLTPVASYGLKLWVTLRTPSYTRNRYRYDRL